MTIGILVVGVLVLLWVMSPTEQKRRRVVGKLEVGDTVEQVVGLLGAPPLRCPGRPLQHLRPVFPPGWPPSSTDAALQQLEHDTSVRLVYPVNRRRAASCAPHGGQTEIGIGPRERVLWIVAVTGKTPLRLPDELTPATPDAAVPQ